jgi:hypothetical protein
MIKENPETTQAYLKSVGDRSQARAHAVFELVGELLAYRSARAALNGPALADWTASYEENLRQLIALAVDSINDVFDSGSWPRIVGILSATPRSTKAEELLAQVRESVTNDFGEQAGASVGVATTLLSGVTIATAPSPTGVRISVTREKQEPLTFELTTQRATGDVARISSASLLARRPRLAVQRRGIVRQRVEGSGIDLGAVDFYGATFETFNWLLDNARSEVRASQRYGRVRVQGEVGAIIAGIVIAVMVALSVGYAIGCTGWVNPDNASNQNTPVCQVLGAITIIGWVLLLIFAGGAIAKTSGPSGGGAYNLNPPQT